MPLISKITDIDKFDFVHHQVQNYPASITELTYDPKFPVRGLWYDFDAINWMWTEPKVWSGDGQLGENWPGGRGVDLQPWIQIPWQERGAYQPHTVWDDALIVIILNLLPFKKKVASIYPGGIQRKDEKRVFVMNTMFNLAETFLIAALIDFYDKQVTRMMVGTVFVMDSGYMLQLIQHGCLVLSHWLLWQELVDDLIIW